MVFPVPVAEMMIAFFAPAFLIEPRAKSASCCIELGRISSLPSTAPGLWGMERLGLSGAT